MATDEGQTGRTILDLDDLPLDMVLQHLSLRDLSNLHKTCKKIQAAVADRFRRIYKNKLKMRYYGLETGDILQTFGEYIEALSVDYTNFDRIRHNFPYIELLLSIVAGIAKLHHSQLNYLKLRKIDFHDCSVLAMQSALIKINRLSFNDCRGKINAILPKFTQMTHFEVIDQSISSFGHGIYRLLSPQLEGLSIVRNDDKDYGEHCNNYGFLNALIDFIDNSLVLRMLRLINVLTAAQFEEILPLIIRKLRHLESLSICTIGVANLRPLIELPCLRHFEINHAWSHVEFINEFLDNKQLDSVGLEDVDDEVIKIVPKFAHLQVLKLTRCCATNITSIVTMLPKLRELYLLKCVVDLNDILEWVETATHMEKLVLNPFPATELIDYTKCKILDQQCRGRSVRLSIHIYLFDRRIHYSNVEGKFENIVFYRDTSNHLCYENDCFGIRSHQSMPLTASANKIPVAGYVSDDEWINDIYDEDTDENELCYGSDNDETSPADE